MTYIFPFMLCIRAKELFSSPGVCMGSAHARAETGISPKSKNFDRQLSVVATCSLASNPVQSAPCSIRVSEAVTSLGAICSHRYYPSVAVFRQGVYELALVFQIIFYALAMSTALRLKIGLLSRLSNTSMTFAVMNAAAVFGLFYFITGRKAVWAR
jgi:hypothetical protein